MEELPTGLYEVLVTDGLKARLDALADALPRQQRALQTAEAPDRIAWHLSREIERALCDVAEADRARVGIEVARALLDRLSDLVEVDSSAAPVEPATVLHTILGRRPLRRLRRRGRVGITARRSSVAPGQGQRAPNPSSSSATTTKSAGRAGGGLAALASLG